MNPRSDASRPPAALVAIATAVCCLGAAVGISHAAAAKSLAQTLVDNALAAHPEATEIGISVQSARGCRSIASTDPGDVGEQCESEERRVMRTQRPYAVRERDGYDVSLPLHDAAGTMIGSISIEFRLRSGQTRAGVIAQATGITKELETHIPSKASLQGRAAA